MTTFVDYAWWQVSPAQLRSMGFSGAMRYCSHDGSKNLTASEAANLRAAGFDIGIVYESVANRAGQGSSAGVADGQFANAFADALGYPGSCTLWYAVDFDASPSQVQPYFDGIASAGGRTFAPYGGVNVINGVHYPGKGWQTVAWSGGSVSGRAGLLQNGFHNDYDSNSVLVEDFGQWRAGSTPIPQPKEDEMLIVGSIDPNQHGQYLLAGGLVIAIRDNQTAVNTIAAGAKTASWASPDFQALADHAI